LDGTDMFFRMFRVHSLATSKIHQYDMDVLYQYINLKMDL